MRKRLFILSALLLTVCGQMWAGRGGTKGEEGIYSGIRFTLYSNYSYYYDDSYYSCDLGDVAVITSFDGYQMIIPETLGGCSKIVIGSGALSSNVRDLQISKSVKLLEFNAVYNAVNMESLTIEDGTTLVCFGAGTPEQSMQNGSFSYIKKLQSVYLGGNLEYDEYSSFYNAPFYNLNTEQAFSLTIGPNVTSIPEDCFGNCDDVKSIKAMPRTPPTLYYNALGNTSAAVPVFVSYKTKDAYTSASGWSTFTNYVLDIDLCKADALNDLDAEAGENPSATVQGVVSDYKNKVNAATSGADVVTNLNAGKLAIQLQKAKDSAIAELTKAKGEYPSGVADKIFDTYKARIEAATSTDEIIAAKEEGIMELQKYAAELKAEKESAKAELDAAKVQYPSEYADNIVSNCKTEIEDATTIEDVKNAKDEGIKNLQLEYNNLQDLKSEAITDLNKAKEAYPSANSNSIVAAGTSAINDATSQSEVSNKKDYYISQLRVAFEAELDNAKNDAMSDLNDAKDEYPSDAADRIVSTYTDKINAATSTDAVTAIKEEGIQALKDAYNVQGEQERLAALDAVTVTQTAEDDYSYLLEDGVRFTFDGDNVFTTVNGEDKPGFTLSETVAIKICPARTFKIKANQDPDHTSDYYTTFYTSEGAYKVPEDGSAKAYAGTMESGKDTDVLKMTDVGSIIHKGEAVILRASANSITLMPSCCKDAASQSSVFTGTDEAMTLGANDYALSLGQHGVGFYLWDGKKIGANKAYLTLDSASKAKAFTFKFEGGAEGIASPEAAPDAAAAYNLFGMRAGHGYKGIVIKNGKKYVVK